MGGGYLPLGAAIYRRSIGEVHHRPRWSRAHRAYLYRPYRGCAAGAAVQKIIRREGLIEHVRTTGPAFMDMLRHALRSIEAVGDIRGRGFLVGIELVADRATKQPFGQAAQVAQRIGRVAAEAGLLCYPSTGNVDGVEGDTVILAPPFNTHLEQLREIAELFAHAVRVAMSEVPILAPAIAADLVSPARGAATCTAGAGFLRRRHCVRAVPGARNTTPSFMTNRTSLSTPDVLQGIARDGDEIRKRTRRYHSQLPRLPSRSAARTVADWIACIGVMPNSTSRANSCAIGSDQAKPPTSVPKAILTPACSAFLKDTSCTATRLRSRLAGVRYRPDPSRSSTPRGGYVPCALLEHLRDLRIADFKSVLDGVAAAIQGALQSNARCRRGRPPFCASHGSHRRWP